MILDQFAMLAVASSRSIKYLDALIENDLLPGFVILMEEEGRLLPGQRVTEQNNEFKGLLKDKDIPYSVIPTADVNSALVAQQLRQVKSPYIIYSGPGGAILGREILNLNKKFIHVHPGVLPDYRGSTTVYYQILAEKRCGATALFLEEKIDSGPVLAFKEYDLPTMQDIDHDYDPSIRADLLVETIQQYLKQGQFNEQKQGKGGEIYYIMHPVLRHIARLKCEGVCVG